MTVDMNLPEIAPENPEKYTSLSEYAWAPSRSFYRTFLINIIVNSNVAVKSFTMKMNKYKQYVCILFLLVEALVSSVNKFNTNFSSFVIN